MTKKTKKPKLSPLQEVSVIDFSVSVTAYQDELLARQLEAEIRNTEWGQEIDTKLKELGVLPKRSAPMPKIQYPI